MGVSYFIVDSFIKIVVMFFVQGSGNSAHILLFDCGALSQKSDQGVEGRSHLLAPVSHQRYLLCSVCNSDSHISQPGPISLRLQLRAQS